MTLQLHNVLGRRREEFAPIDPRDVRMYVCGPTVYDRAHIGNARPVVAFDTLFRLLRRIYGADHVRYVRNVTDIDDKIMARAEERGEPTDALAERYAAHYAEDMAALHTLTPTAEPRATGHIAGMIAMIETLIAKGHAYAADGHALFATASFPDYGALSGCDRDAQIAGARVEVAPYKREPTDFVLWKPSTDDQPGWDSPWGRGRPGWHIECSAMSAAHFGASFDIHGGGADLAFPHHENEIAQSVCAHNAPFARVWVHNGYVLVDGEKMAKSAGNFVTVADALALAPGAAVRAYLLSAQYRQPLDWRAAGLQAAKDGLDRIFRALHTAADIIPAVGAVSGVFDALCDDLNTPKAFAALHADAAALNAGEDRPASKARLIDGLDLMGLGDVNPAAWLGLGGADDAEAGRIDALLADRQAARKAKNFAEADRIRDALAAEGVLIEDGPDGPVWRRVG
ncbi:MAG: cysteine--tRNA ligase [Pseudomonadota bacterium]